MSKRKQTAKAKRETQILNAHKIIKSFLDDGVDAYADEFDDDIIYVVVKGKENLIHIQVSDAEKNFRIAKSNAKL